VFIKNQALNLYGKIIRLQQLTAPADDGFFKKNGHAVRFLHLI